MVNEAEPLRVKIGEPFKPFAGINSLDDLKRGERVDCLFETRFLLEGLGLGCVAILGPESLLDEDQSGNFLDLSKKRARLFSVEGPIGRVAVSIDRMPEFIITEPHLICSIGVDGNPSLELKSVGIDSTVEANEGPAFLWFARQGEDPAELIIDASAANLRKIILRLDRE